MPLANTSLQNPDRAAAPGDEEEIVLPGRLGDVGRLAKNADQLEREVPRPELAGVPIDGFQSGLYLFFRQLAAAQHRGPTDHGC